MRVGKPKFTKSDFRTPDKLSGFVHKIGHEVGNPLTSIISLASILHRIEVGGSDSEKGRAKLFEYCEAISKEAWRIASLNDRLVLFLSDRVGAPSKFPLTGALRRAESTLKKNSLFEDIVIKRLSSLDEEVELFFDPDQFNWALTALFENGALAVLEQDSSTPKPIEVEWSTSKSRVTLSIRNFRPEPCTLDLDTLFEPFVVENIYAKRSGLGLSVVASILERGGATIELQERVVADGYSFTAQVTLPTDAATANSNSTPASNPSASSKAGTKSKTVGASPSGEVSRWESKIAPLPETIRVAVVEDERSVGTAMQKILELVFGRKKDFRCFLYGAEEFLQQLEANGGAGEQFDAVLCDLNLGHVSGRFVYETVQQKYPALLPHFAFLTGDRLSHETQAFLESSGRMYLHKPFEAEALIELVITLTSLSGRKTP